MTEAARSAALTSADLLVPRLEARLLRQTRARQEAENLLEEKSLALYRVNESLQKLTDELEDEVKRQTHQLTKALEQATIATKAKDAFLANLSHEVRTPLNAIMGLTQLLSRTELSDEQNNYVNLLDGSASNLMILLNDILDFSKIASGNLSFSPIQFDFLKWIEQTTGPYALQAKGKQLKFTLNLGPELPHAVVGDPHRLRQVLTNLLTNALKFTERGDISVKVDLDPDQSQIALGQIRVLFAVADTGIGIASDKQKQIFEPFIQADSSITRTYGGTGLGLTISTRLVSQMQGKMSLESLEGLGSTFSFSVVLDFNEKAIPSSSPSLSKPQDILRNLNILVAEDHPINQLLMGKLLTRWGANVVFADNGLMACEKYLQEDFDLIFMDMQMPIMGGFEATQTIRKAETDRRRIPIIALTAHAMPGDRERCLEAGMDAYVSKPVNEAELLQAVADVLTK
jgi:signal transduction histidine kinase/CheY-like chemotaxis protein